MIDPPKSIKALKEEGILELGWPDGRVYRIPFKYVRGECHCASCIEEWTGRQLLDLDTVPETIQPLEMNFVGNYALKIAWSDGHSTGLYTWDHLMDVSERHGSPV